MPKRLEPFRAGDRREAIALAYLRCLGFIAPIPREEDVGLDGIVTLAELKGNLNYPKETFGVQIKSSTEEAVYYGTDDFDRLHLQSFPMFFVVRDPGKMEFFSTTNLSIHSPDNSLRGPAFLWFRRGPSSERLRVAEQKYFLNPPNPAVKGRRPQLKRGQTHPTLEIMLGEPIVQIDEHDLETSKEYRAFIFQIIQRHVQLEIKARTYQKLGCVFDFSWSTGELPECVITRVQLTESLDVVPKEKLDLATPCRAATLSCAQHVR